MDLIQKLITRWYIIAAALIVILSIKHTFENYPGSAPVHFGENGSLEVHAKVLEKIDSLRENRGGLVSEDSAVTRSNPFRIKEAAVSQKPVKSGRKSAKTAPRNFILKGITNGNTAILLNSENKSFVVEIGDVVDGSKIIEITPNTIKIKDKSGLYTLKLDQ